MSSSSSTSAAFGQTLQFITSIKLQELEKQRLSYQEHAKVLQKADACGDDLIAKVELLLEAVESWSGSGSVTKETDLGGKLNLTNLRMWLRQAKQDPNFSPDMIRTWIDTLETHIHHSMMRFDGAKLFGNLLNEWIASGDSSVAPSATANDDAESAISADFEKVGRQEMHDQLAKLTSIIFDEAIIDTDALEYYLDDLFSGEEAAKALEKLRKDINSFETDLRREKFTASMVKNIIRGLLATENVEESKRTTLAEFSNNETVLEEVASVLTMRMASLETWSWPAEGMNVEMRRQLNGKYRCGVYGSRDHRRASTSAYRHFLAGETKNFLHILSSKAWRKPDFLENYKHVAEQMPSRHSIVQRRLLQQRDSFLTQLASSAKSIFTYDDSLDTSGVGRPAATKQKLLQIMATEAQLNTTLHGSYAVIRSDLEWFGPSLPHRSILAVLKFFGISEEWCAFFRRFLRAPLRFKGDPPGQVRTRLRGTPITYALSVMCGEAILFVMDFAVNQRADGLFLYRQHDDLWLWDADPAKCATGWKEMNVYADLVGLKFNESKTGSAWVGSAEPAGLPAGDIRWGFLRFDTSEARFVIDQKDVDLHITELRRQLASTKSVFGWVNTYNKYMAFFMRNFGGRPAPCFGDAHVTDIIDTISRIQKEVFPDIQGGAVAYLRSVIETRFGIKDLPQGYFYLPISSGGLELRHPMIEMFALVQRKPEEAQGFEDLVKRDEQRYKALKDAWDDPRNHRDKEDPFMTLEEYLSLRESWLQEWRACYEDMMTVSRLAEVQETPLVKSFMSQSEMSWFALDWYEQWIVSLYGEEVVDRFGSCEVVDPTLIPVGMVQLFRTSRMKLDQ